LILSVAFLYLED